MLITFRWWCYEGFLVCYFNTDLFSSPLANGTETVAVKQDDGTYKLFGYKWFSSATDADITFTLARVVDGQGNTIQVFIFRYIYEIIFYTYLNVFIIRCSFQTNWLKILHYIYLYPTSDSWSLKMLMECGGKGQYWGVKRDYSKFLIIEYYNEILLKDWV